MSRPADWWVLDLPGDPTPGDPGQVRVLARSAGRMADDAADAHRAVRGLAGDSAVLSWLGAAGEVFRGALGDFPQMLGKLQDSYEQAADALRWWAGRLDDLQATADRALAQGRQARAEVEALQAQLASARAAASSASAASARLSQVPAGGPPPDPAQLRAAVSSAHAAAGRVSALSGQLHSAQARLAAARSLAEQARALRQSDARTTAHRLRDASDAGIAPTSRWEKFKEAAAAAWKVTVTVATVVAVVVAVVALFVGGPVVWGVLLAASAVLLADSLHRYGEGEASGWEVGLNLLGVVPGGRLLTAVGKLTGLAGAGARVAGAVSRPLTAAGTRLRTAAAAVRSGADDLVTHVRARGLVGDTGSVTVARSADDAVRHVDLSTVTPWSRGRPVPSTGPDADLYPPGFDRYGGLGEQRFHDRYWDPSARGGQGGWKWPPDNGFAAEPVPNTLQVDDVIDRFGPDSGFYASPASPPAPFPDRALAPSSVGDEYHRYRVVKPLPDTVVEGPAAPWFEQPGGATQYFFDRPLNEYVPDFLEPLP